MERNINTGLSVNPTQVTPNCHLRIILSQSLHHFLYMYLDHSFCLFSIPLHNNFHLSKNTFLSQIYYHQQTIHHRNRYLQMYIDPNHAFYHFSTHHYKHLQFTFEELPFLTFYLSPKILYNDHHYCIYIILHLLLIHSSILLKTNLG